MDENRKKAWVHLLQEAGFTIGGSKVWHWFRYHFSFLPPHPFARSIVDACADCEMRIKGLGSQFIQDIASIQGKEKHLPHYDQLLQKLAELLVLRQLLGLDWPAGTTFEHEPAINAKGKRPELRVVTPERAYLFEVKTPSLLEHARTRGQNAIQAPCRALPQNQLEQLAQGGGLTLPRDNPVKDFLIDADQKFGQFKDVSPHTAILVIVWDDHIYEPITVLMHPQCGLLTANSYFKDAQGEATKFSYTDGVVIIRHLNYIRQAAGDQPLADRDHALDFGTAQDLPNVLIPNSDTLDLPALVREGLRLKTLDDPVCQHAAEYRPQDMVMWF